MSSIDTAAPPGNYGTGLVLFGILDLAAGVLYLAKTVIYALLAISGAAASIPAEFGRAEIPVTSALSLAPAAFFLAIGFGSILARRWARALSLAFSSLWLAGGAIGAAFLFAGLPRMFGALAPLRERSASPSFISPAIRAYAFIFLVAIVLPGAYVLFYRARGVKAECDRRDPDERWTDRLSITDLASAMVLAVGALLALHLGFSTTRQLLFFGHPLGSGMRGLAAAMAAAEIAAAWGICRGDRRAWTAAVAIMGIRAAADAAIAWRVAGAGIEPIVRRAESVRPDAKAAIDRLAPLHPLAAVALCVTVLALASWAFVAWAALRARAPTASAAR